MTRFFDRSSFSGKTFALGALAGVMLLGTGLMLGGAQRGRPGNARPDADFDSLRVQKLDIVDRHGHVRLRLRGSHSDGGSIKVMDRSGDVRVEMLADGSVRTYGGNGKIRALLGRDPHGWGERRGGVLELFDPYGNHIVRLPGSQHPSDCSCEVCSGAYRPWDNGGHDDHHDGHHDHHGSPQEDTWDDEYDRPRRPGWRWGRDEE